MKIRPRASLCTAVTAIGLATGLTAVAVTQPESITILVTPAALIVVGSSTNQTGAGIADFFGSRFTPVDENDIVTVPFSAGPAGITNAVQQYSGSPNVILSSGWSAAYSSVALSDMSAAGDPALAHTLWILDNNVVAPNGGFGTRYPVFSTLTGVPTEPTPTDTGVSVVSTAYKYDVNSNTPQYVLNAFAVANTLVAYFQRRLTQQTLKLPVNDDGTPDCPGGAYSCTVTVADGTDDGIVTHIKRVGSVTYVTYEPTDGLPLVAPLRQFGPIGAKLAYVLEPVLTALVNWGYPNNDPIGDPNNLQPRRLVPTFAENVRFVEQFVAGVLIGLSRLGPSPAPPPPQTSPTSAPLAQTSLSPAPSSQTSLSPAPAPQTSHSPSSRSSAPAALTSEHTTAPKTSEHTTAALVSIPADTTEKPKTPPMNADLDNPNDSPDHRSATPATGKPGDLKKAVESTPARLFTPKPAKTEAEPPSGEGASTDTGAETPSRDTSPETSSSPSTGTQE